MVSASDSNGSPKKPAKASKAISAAAPEPAPAGTDRNYYGIVQPRNFPPLPEGWVSDWETLESSNQKHKLFWVHHHAADWKSHRAVLVLHGLGEHGGRYLHFPHYLRPEVESVSCLDFLGHGRSEGLRGHIESFETFADDVGLATRKLEARLRARFGKAEIHLFAHSMGGLIALRALQKDQTLPLASVTLSAPLLAIKVKVPLVKRTAARLLSRVWGSLQMMSVLDPNDLSHDQEVAHAYVADRLVHRKVTPRFFSQLQDAMAQVTKVRRGPGYAIQVLLPGEDSIVDAKAVERYFRQLRNSDHLVRSYPELFHESFNEIGKEKVFEDIRKWIHKHYVRS